MTEATLLDMRYLAGALLALLALAWVNRSVSREFDALEREEREGWAEREERDAWAGIEELVALELKEREERSTTSRRNRPRQGPQVRERAGVRSLAKPFNH